MASPAGALIAATEAALLASATLATVLGNRKAVFNQVPPKEPLPYVLFGDVQVLHEEDDDCAEEKEAFSTVHVWSRPDTLDGGVQAAAIAAAVVAALNAQLTLTGWNTIVWQTQDERYLTDPDQSIHVVLVFRYLLTEQVA